MNDLHACRCLFCGVSFEAKYRMTRFCTAACSRKADRAGLSHMRWIVVDENGALLGGAESFERALHGARALPASRAIIQSRTGGVVWKRTGFEGLGPLVLKQRAKHRHDRDRRAA